MKRLALAMLGVGAIAVGALGVADEKAPLKVFIFAGQSNMVGVRSNAADLPADLQGEQPGALFFDGTAWTPLAPGKTEPKGFGPEIACARALGVALNEPIGIVKHSAGGTNLALQWSPANTNSLYARLLAKVKAAQASRPIELVGLFWMQGESDARTQAMAEAYQSNLEAFIERARRDFASPGMVFIAGRVNPPVQTFPFAETVRKGQEACRAPRYAFIDCDSLPKGPDNLHYTTQGLVEMGNRFAEALLKLNAAPAPANR